MRKGFLYFAVLVTMLCVTAYLMRASKGPGTALKPSPPVKAKVDDVGNKIHALLRSYADWSVSQHSILGEGYVRSLRVKLEQASRRVSTSNKEEYQQFLLMMKLSHAEIKLGHLDVAIELAESAARRLERLKKKVNLPERISIKLLYDLGIAYMRRGETLNCCKRKAAENCILPIRGAGIHKNQNDSKEAIIYFEKVIEISAPNSPYYVKAKWLLNVMYMTLGTYPDAVPAAHRIEPSVFESEENFPRFTNVASKLGVDVFDLLGGVVIDDFTGDGYLDIIVSTYDPKEGMRFFRNQQNGTFIDETEQSGLYRALGGFNLIQADYDNDGDMDIYVMRGAWMGVQGKVPNSLLQNNGKGVFVDATYAAGLGDFHYPSQTAAWADYDQDGHIDLYVGNESSPGNIAPCQLLHNNGDGTFTDMAKEAGVLNLRFSKGVVWGDYDNDGFADIYVSNYGAENRLYRNNHNGTFSDVAKEVGVAKPTMSFPAWFWDFNNDGLLDLYVSSYDWREGNLTAVVKSQLGLPTEVKPARLYQGIGKGAFRDVAKEQNLQAVTLPMGSNRGDLDNDGYLDFYLGTGYPDYEALMPSVMYLNKSGNGFANITTAGGFGHLQKGHGIAFGDLDNDGDLDIYGQMGGFYAGDKAFNTLFENPGMGNHWITIKLIGVHSNRSAIGARIHIQIEEKGRLRSIYRHVNSGGTFGANPLRQTIGLGKATSIKRIEIDWPLGGKKQIFNDVSMDQFIEITEGKEAIQKRSFKAFKLGG